MMSVPICSLEDKGKEFGLLLKNIGKTYTKDFNVSARHYSND